MRLANNLSKVTLKICKEAMTGKIGLSWLTHTMKDFGVEMMSADKYLNIIKDKREVTRS